MAAGLLASCAVSHFICTNSSKQDNLGNQVTLVSTVHASNPDIVISKMVDNFENKSNTNLRDSAKIQQRYNKAPKT